MKPPFMNAHHLVFLLVTTVATTALCATGEVRSLRACRTASPPVIDGRLDEPVWDEAERAVGFSNYNQPTVMAKDQTIGRVLFDDENLYVGIECLESRMDLLRKDLDEMGTRFDYGKGGVIEIFVDPGALGGTDYCQFLVGTNGASWGSFYDVMQIAPMPFRASASLGDDRFFIEVRIPFSILHLSPSAAPTWGFNLNRARLLERETSRGPNDNRFSSWSNTNGAFNRPQRFGRLAIDLDTSRYRYDVKLLQSPPDTLAVTEVEVANGSGRAAALRAVLAFEAEAGRKTYEQRLALENAERRVLAFPGPFPDWTGDAALSLALVEAATEKTVYYGGTRSADVTPRHRGPVPAYAAADIENGCVLFTKDYNSLILRTYMPSVQEANGPLEIYASPGEYEPCVLGVRTFKTLSDVSLETAGDLVCPGAGSIRADDLDLRIITHTKYWTPNGLGREFRWQPMLAESSLPDVLAPDRTYTYLITLKAPENAAAGTYTGRLVFRARGIEPRTVPVHVTIWPIALQQPPDMCWGYYYDVARMPEERRSLEYQKKIFRNVAEHGSNNITIYGGIAADGSLDRCDGPYLPFQQTINDALETGAMTRGIPIMTLSSAISTPAVEAAREQHHWPELLMYAYDEPDDEERIAQARKGLTEIKRAHPEVKTVTAISEHGLEALGDLYDAWVVGAGSIGTPVVAEGRAKGKLIWAYDCGNHVCNLPFNRYFAGLWSWKAGVTGNWLWGLVDVQFEHRLGRPMAEVLKHDAQALWRVYRETPEAFNFTFNYVWPAPEGPIPSVGHIGRREGIDDYRYVYTLTRLIDQAEAGDDPGARRAARESRELLESFLGKISVDPWAEDVYPHEQMRQAGQIVILGDWRPDSHIALEDHSKFRKRIAGQIVRLQKIVGG